MTDEDYHVSPSQQVTYIHGCARYWAFSYIYGLKEATTDAADRGHKVHKVLEDWQIFATPPDMGSLFGRIAKPAIKYTPPPMSPGVIPEKRVEWTSPQGNKFVFLKDLEYPFGPVAYVWDYKSTSNLRYAHTAEELLESDPQGITYAAHRFIESPDVQLVKEAWLYLPASAPHYCHPVYADQERNHCLGRFALLDTIAGYMLEHRRKKTNPMAFAPNPSQCRAFNRQCPFTDRCNLSELDQLMAANQPNLGPVSNAFLSVIGRNAEPTPGAGAAPTMSIPQAQPVSSGFALAAAMTPPSAPALPSFNQLPQAPAAPAAPAAPVVAQIAELSVAPVCAPGLPWAVQPAPMLAALQPAPVATTPINTQLQWPPPQTQAALAAPKVEIALPDSSPPARRKRRSKAEMEAARAALANGTVTAEQAEDLASEGTDEGAESYERRVVENTTTINSPLQVVSEPEPLLVRIALAMAANPGYCNMCSTDFAQRARRFTAAIQAELADQ